MLKTVSLKYQNTTVDFFFYKYDKEDSANDSFEFHKHLNYEIHFALSGCYKYSFVDKSVVLNKNEMLIIPPGELHKVIRPQGENYEFTVLTIRFSSADADQFYDYFHSMFKQNSLKCLQVQENVVKSVFKLNNVVAETTNDCLQSIYLTSCAAEILYELCSAMAENRKKWPVSENSKNIEVKIENMVNANMSVTDIANKINYSTRHTERLVKKIYGKSLSEIRRDFICK